MEDTMSLEKREGYYRKPENGGVVELAFYGEITSPKLAFIKKIIHKFNIKKTTLTKDGHLRIWNLDEETLDKLLEESKIDGIVCNGAYTKESKKIFCSPLSGMTDDEAFNVRPYANAARSFFANSPTVTGCSHSIQRFYFAGKENDLAEAKDCDVIFLAKPANTFKIFVKNQSDEFFVLSEDIEANKFLSYLEVASKLYGEELSPDDYKNLFFKSLGKLENIPTTEIDDEKNANYELAPLKCHHFGGVIPITFWENCKENMLLRIDRNLNLYICNLQTNKNNESLELLNGTASTRVEQSGVSDRCSICPAGVIEPQEFMNLLLSKLHSLNLVENVLPTFTISGCERCCFTVPREELIFVTQTEVPEGRKQKRYHLIRLHLDNDQELGYIAKENIENYLIKLASLVQAENTDFKTWYEKNKKTFEEITQSYCKE